MIEPTTTAEPHAPTFGAVIASAEHARKPRRIVEHLQIVVPHVFAALNDAARESMAAEFDPPSVGSASPRAFATDPFDYFVELFAGKRVRSA